MATCQTVITRAMRLLGLLEDGGAPSSTELDDGLASLQAMIHALPELMLGGPWTDVDVTDTTYLPGVGEAPGEDVRIRLTDDTVSTDITLPARIEDSDAETGYRKPREGARIQIIAELSGSPYRRTYVYTAYAGWERIDALALSDASPFGPELEDALTALLAQRMAPEFSAAVSPQVQEMATRGRTQIDHRLRPNTVTEIQAY